MGSKKEPLTNVVFFFSYGYAQCVFCSVLLFCFCLILNILYIKTHYFLIVFSFMKCLRSSLVSDISTFCKISVDATVPFRCQSPFMIFKHFIFILLSWTYSKIVLCVTFGTLECFGNKECLFRFPLSLYTKFSHLW